MLVDITRDLNITRSDTVTPKAPASKPLKVSSEDVSPSPSELIPVMLKSPHALGPIIPGMTKHFYSDGAFNLIQLIFYIVGQIGPAHVLLSTYSIADDAIESLRRQVDRGRMLSVRFLIDNRVRSISPKPFAHLAASFPDDYRCLALHAKVALVWNDSMHVTVVGSQNATHNPKLERGIIFTDEEVFRFDKNYLEHAFNEGTA
jgi:hypothetical protein